MLFVPRDPARERVDPQLVVSFFVGLFVLAVVLGLCALAFLFWKVVQP